MPSSLIIPFIFPENFCYAINFKSLIYLKKINQYFNTNIFNHFHFPYKSQKTKFNFLVLYLKIFLFSLHFILVNFCFFVSLFCFALLPLHAVAIVVVKVFQTGETHEDSIYLDKDGEGSILQNHHVIIGYLVKYFGLNEVLIVLLGISRIELELPLFKNLIH